MRHLRILACCALAFGLSACATVTRGTKEKFAIVSNPPGATARLSTGQSCTTPCTLKLPRDIEFKVTFNRDGYAPVVRQVKTGGYSQDAMLGNFIVGGLVGVLVDSNNGSLMSLSPNPLKVEMLADTAPADGQALATAAPAATGGSPTPAAVPAATTTVAPATSVTLSALEARRATELDIATGQSARIYEVLEGPNGSIISVSVIYDGRIFAVPGATISAGETAVRLKTSLTAKQVGKLKGRRLAAPSGVSTSDTL